MFFNFLTEDSSCTVSVTVLQIRNPLIFSGEGRQSVLCRGKLELKFISLFVGDL